MTHDKLGLPAREDLAPAKVHYVLRILDDDWEEEVKSRRLNIDSQDAIERLLQLLDEDEKDAAATRLMPGAAVPGRCYLLEGYFHA